MKEDIFKSAEYVSGVQKDSSDFLKRVGVFSLPFPNRVGRNDQISEYLAIMSQCLIVRAEAMYDSATIKYTAYSMQFEINPDGRFCPEYEWIVDYKADKSFAVFARKK